MILAYLMTGKSITDMEALLMFDCRRLSGRIYNLRKLHNIETEMITTPTGKRIAKYSYKNQNSSCINKQS